MAYGIQPYRVDLQKIRQQYGTTDAALKEKIIASCESWLEDLDDDFRSDDGWIDSKTLLSAFLDGKWQKPDGNTAKHWYIIELLIKGFGKLLSNRHWYPAGISPMYDYSEFRMYYLGPNSPVPISGVDDFPVVFTIERSNFNQALANIQKDYPNSDQQAEFASWIEAAREHDQDLVLYYF